MELSQQGGYDDPLNPLVLVTSLQQLFGHLNFRSVKQRQAIEAANKGQRDLIVSMPTGSGKSLIYQLPAVLKDKQFAIVVSPLLSLIKDQIDHLRKLGIIAETINSKISNFERNQILSDLLAERPECKLLYVTPEMVDTERFKENLKSFYRAGKISYFVVDEVHCVNQWGHSFRFAYVKLGDIKEAFPNVPWIALTATASSQVKKDIFKYLKLTNPLIFELPCFRPNLFYDNCFMDLLKDPFDHLYRFALSCLGKGWQNVEKSNRPCGIVYCRTIEKTAEMAEMLTKRGLLTKAYHAGLTTATRNQVQDEWMQGEVPVIAATTSFGMGIDKASVRFVAHWYPPKSATSYYQESGRAGRDDVKSFCRVYYKKQDHDAIDYLIRKECEKLNNDTAMNDFQRMANYYERNPVCRHSIFAKCFGDENFKDCGGMCDFCENPNKVKKDVGEFAVFKYSLEQKQKKVWPFSYRRNSGNDSRLNSRKVLSNAKQGASSSYSMAPLATSTRSSQQPSKKFVDKRKQSTTQKSKLVDFFLLKIEKNKENEVKPKAAGSSSSTTSNDKVVGTEMK